MDQVGPSHVGIIQDPHVNGAQFEQPWCGVFVTSRPLRVSMVRGKQ